jgi:hypothetical protein
VLDDASQGYAAPGMNNSPGTNKIKIQTLGGNKFHLTVDGIPGQVYTIQSTTNLNIPWHFLGSGTADESGTFFLDVTSTSSPDFYRSSYP